MESYCIGITYIANSSIVHIPPPAATYCAGAMDPLYDDVVLVCSSAIRIINMTTFLDVVDIYGWIYIRANSCIRPAHRSLKVVRSSDNERTSYN